VDCPTPEWTRLDATMDAESTLTVLPRKATILT
jgi:hypothetical protein